MAYLSVPDDRINFSHILSNPSDFYGATPYTYWFAALLILIFGPGLFAADTLLRRCFDKKGNILTARTSSDQVELPLDWQATRDKLVHDFLRHFPGRECGSAEAPGGSAMQAAIASGVMRGVVTALAIGIGIVWRRRRRSQHRMRYWLSITGGNSVRSQPPQDAENGWLPATVPGDVHLDLLANKKIPDPFYRDNEAKLQWIENESWEYRLKFDATPALLSHSQRRPGLRRARCGLKGYLNGIQVLSADNMFRIWRVPRRPSACGQESAARRVSVAHQGRAEVAAARSVAAKDQDRAPRPTSARPHMSTDGTGVRAL